MRSHFAIVPPFFINGHFYSPPLNSFRRDWSLPIAPKSHVSPPPPPPPKKIPRPLSTGDKQRLFL